MKQGTSKKWQEESREESVSIFLNTSICLLPEKKNINLWCQRIKTSHVVVRRVSQCLTFLLDSDHRRPKVFNNHRVSWELVYQNELLKTMLTNSPTPSLPSSHAVFTQLFSTSFLHYLGAWNRLKCSIHAQLSDSSIKAALTRVS